MSDPSEPTSSKSGIRFSPTIELGHLVQVVAMLVMIGGWAIVGYQTITRQLDQHAAEMALFKQRLTVDETAIRDLRANLQSASAETRTQLSKILDAIADLRTVVAAQTRNGPRR